MADSFTLKSCPIARSGCRYRLLRLTVFAQIFYPGDQRFAVEFRLELDDHETLFDPTKTG